MAKQTDAAPKFREFKAVVRRNNRRGCWCSYVQVSADYGKSLYGPYGFWSYKEEAMVEAEKEAARHKAEYQLA